MVGGNSSIVVLAEDGLQRRRRANSPLQSYDKRNLIKGLKRVKLVLEYRISEARLMTASYGIVIVM